MTLTLFKQAYKWQVRDVKPLWNGSAGGDVSPETQQQAMHQDHDSDEEEERGGERSPQDEVPITKNMLAKFKSMEDLSKPPPTPEHSKVIQKAAIGSVHPTPPAPSTVTGYVYREGEQAEDPDALYTSPPTYSDQSDDEQETRNGDLETTENLPEQGTTRNLLAKFQAISSQ